LPDQAGSLYPVPGATLDQSGQALAHAVVVHGANARAAVSGCRPPPEHGGAALRGNMAGSIGPASSGAAGP
jgi:hypothetical protein